ncbi:MAG: hypothetical protein M3680_17690 [Myxococcota bacterium]|nr:hypothetical protein [Myxococcota bacterium]
MGHYETSVLHEVGHGVGQRMGGNTYASAAGSWPGWTPMTAQSFGEEMWTAGTGPVDATVTSNAKKMKDEHVKAFLVSELGQGKNTYKSGGGLIDGTTKAMLGRLDTEAYATTNASGTEGVQYPTVINKGGADGGNGGAGGGGQGGGGSAGTEPERQPLCFPW